MKIAKDWLVLTALVLATVCITAGAALRQPMTLEELYPHIDLENSDAISLLCRIYPCQEDYDAVYHDTLYPEDEGFAELLGLLEGAVFRRKAPPLGSIRRHTILDGDVEWELAVGQQYHWIVDISNYFGDLTICSDEGDHFYGCAMSDDWRRKVYEVIAQHGTPAHPTPLITGLS